MQTLASQIQRVFTAPTTKKDAQNEGEQIKEVNEDVKSDQPTIDVEGGRGTRGRGVTPRKFSKMSFTYIFISYLVNTQYNYHQGKFN